MGDAKNSRLKKNNPLIIWTICYENKTNTSIDFACLDDKFLR